jgi:putative membrane protein
MPEPARDRHAAAPPERPPAGPTGAFELVRHGLFGFFMGAADTVPGVSGGTVAFVCGIYERLIDGIRDIVRGATRFVRGERREGLVELRRFDWRLLVPLLGGILLAVVTLASTLERLLEEQPVRMAGLFLGLVLGSVVVAWRILRRPNASAALIVVVAAIATFLLLGLRESTATPEAADPTAPLWTYPLAAMVAICAMILPGVSGSFLLLTMGMYDDLLGAVNQRDLLPLVLFAGGCVVGLAAFSRVLAWLMDTHHDRVVAALIGLMLGSVRILWPWPDGLNSTELGSPAGGVWIPVALAVVGFVAVMILGAVGALKEEPPPHPG